MIESRGGVPVLRFYVFWSIRSTEKIRDHNKGRTPTAILVVEAGRGRGAENVMGSYNTALAWLQVFAPDAANNDTQKRLLSPSGQVMFIHRDQRISTNRNNLKRRRKIWTPGKIISVANLYLSDIKKTILGLFGGPCDTDDGEMYYMAAVELLVMRFVAMQDDDRNPKPLDSHAWAWKLCPKLAADRPHAWFLEQERRILEGLGAKRAELPSADKLADAIHVTHAQVIEFKLRSIGAVDRRAPQRKAEEKQADAKRKRQDRGKDGAIPHSESMAAQKPWEAYGISEPTFRRWVRDGKVPAHPTQRRARAKSR